MCGGKLCGGFVIFRQCCPFGKSCSRVVCLRLKGNMLYFSQFLLCLFTFSSFPSFAVFVALCLLIPRTLRDVQCVCVFSAAAKLLVKFNEDR